MSQILIAEDNDFTALQYSKILSKHGHKVDIARDGDECLAKYRSTLTVQRYDLVILDHNIPKKNGADVAAEILSLNSNQKVIFASAYSNSCERNFDMIKNKVTFLQKPFSLNKLIQLIN